MSIPLQKEARTASAIYRSRGGVG